MGDQRSVLALESQAYRIAQYIGEYIISLGGLDVITFAGGVGENGIETRERVCKYLEPFGIKLDLEKNKIRGKEACISADDSKVKIYVVPTNEELMIAKDADRLIRS
jgi:acetate kinase